MPLPSINDQHVDAYLTNLSVGWIQAPSNFVAPMAAPQLPVDKKSDRIAQFSRADLFRDEMQVRSDGAESAGSGYRVSRDTYLCDVYASHIDVGDQTLAGADNPYRPLEDATQVLVQRERIKRERQFATEAFATSIWTGGTSADPTAASLSAAWDDPASTPIEDIHEQGNSVLVKTGQLPNTLIVNYLGWTALKNHPDIVDRIKHTSGSPVTEDLVARLLGLDRVLVSKAPRNTAQEGATASNSSILGNHALLVYVSPNPGLYEPGGLVTFVWRGYPGSTDGRLIRRFRIEENRATRVEAESAFDVKVLDADSGVLIQSVAS